MIIDKARLEKEMYKIKNNDILSFSERHKNYEKLMDVSIPNDLNFLIRLDGKTFSKRVKQWKLQKPFDERFNKCMKITCETLFKELQNIQAIWSGSDEITLVFKSDNQEQLFSGRINKLLSITSSIATSAFNFAALENGIDKIKEYPAWFDSRIIVVPSKEECINNILQRQQDCVRNSISQYALSVYSTKELSKKNSVEKQQMMNDKGIDWNDYPNWSKFGMLFYKRNVLFDLNTHEIICITSDKIEIDETKNYMRTKIFNESKKYDFKSLYEVIMN